MKTKITIITAFLLLGINISFGQWVEQSVSNSPTKIDCIDGTNCFAGLFNGDVIKTTDGINWVNVSFTTGNGVGFLKMFSADTCYVFTDDFFRTTDGGQNWVEATPSNVYPAFFLNTSTGFGIGSSGTFYKTIDAGDTWTQINTIPSENEGITSVFFSDEMTGFICGGNDTNDKVYIYKTTNGGGSWTKVFERTTTAGFLKDIEMATAQVGIACGQANMLLRTTDGGDTWNDVAYPLSGVSNLMLLSVDFINSNSGYVVGAQNAIMRTIDGGNTWSDESYTIGNMNEVSIGSLDTVYIATSQFKILKNSNANLVVNIFENNVEIGKIYPNPVNDILKVEIKESSEISIVDATGKEILTKDLSKTELNSINLSTLESGMYFYRITSKNSTLSTGKFSKN